jgi:hypothetical protein
MRASAGRGYRNGGVFHRRARGGVPHRLPFPQKLAQYAGGRRDDPQTKVPGIRRKAAGTTAIVNPARYRARSLPVAGALLKPEDLPDKQLSLL